nr:GIY-YIG nuclease family protein [Ruminiclostridium papyrosolvens]
MSNFKVYILSCSDGTYYTGYTSDLQKRLQQHQEGHGCTYTKTRTPVELVYTEELPDKPSALKREKQIKKLTIFDKEKLIEKSRAN